MSNNSLGGIGQRVPGASAHTLTIWNYINEYPGVTRDELKAKAIEFDWIPRGYAHRFYAHKIRRKGAAPDLAEASRRSDRAVHLVVMETLRLMQRNGSIRRDESDGCYAVRRPQATAQVEARVRPRDEVMAGVLLNEARRKLLAYGIDRLRTPAARLPLDIRESLAKWLEAGQLVEHDID